MSTYLFIDKDHNVLTGDRAKAAIAEAPAAECVRDGHGTIAVSKERWETAQAYERNTWIKECRDAADDRNYDHCEMFERYRALKGMVFPRAIELGCGPFTNLRLISGQCRIKACTLLDPLIREYLDHPHCAYDRQFLRAESRLSFPLCMSGLFWREGRVLRTLRRRITVEAMLAMPIEEMPIGGRYDLVVLMNVLEHCYNIDKVFQQVAAMMGQGSILVFHDKYLENGESGEAGHVYDAGHPLRPRRDAIDAFLGEHFRPLYRKVGRIRHVVEGVDLSHDALYFVGRFQGPTG